MDCRPCRLLLATLIVAYLATPAAAADDCHGPSSDCVAVGGWNFSVALGAGVRTDPVLHESNIPLVVIPQVSYYGEHFFLDNFDLGVTLADSDSSTFSLVASPGYDRVFFYRSDPQNFFVSGFNALAGSANPQTGLETPASGDNSRVVRFPPRSRAITYLAGPEWTFKYAGITGQLDVLHEITGHNHGDEVRAALGVPLPHWGGAWSTDLGLTWKSAAIVNYYYGAPQIYQGGSALDPFVKLAFSHPLGGRWKFTAFVESERLANAIHDSPIINARFVTTGFVGTTYSF